MRERLRLRGDQRDVLSSWPFDQLGQHLAYKARKAGVPFLEVDAAYTSQRCPRCGHTEKANRPTRDHFRCRRCGLSPTLDFARAGGAPTPRRRRRRGQRARPCTLGVGICHHARPTTGLAAR
ncbi:transposase [Streptomyces acidicola]|uniref:transposase n=1 Tax=Streptomyces acidicola TaxID=2596892 RepID=UPI00343D43EE